MTIISQANTITVNNINDSGAGSLRQASIDAVSGDTIRFNSNLLTTAVDSISLVTEIDFGAKGIVIKGLYTATDTLFISGANNSRIFSFYAAGKVVLDSVVLVNGNSNSGGAVFYNFGNDTINIENSIFRNNSANYGGGGLYSSSSSSSGSYVLITNSTFSNNFSSNGNGGGIFSFKNGGLSSSVTVTNSVFSNNLVSIGDGGGIYSYGNGGFSSVTITNSTFNNNSATSGKGGGVFSDDPAFSGSTSSNTVIINNSTFNNNSSTSGGAVYSNSFSLTSDVTVSNSTFSDNSSINGGGVYSSSVNASSSVTLRSSIFDNSNINNGGLNTITSLGYNIFSDSPTGATGTGDQTNITLMLQSLAFNGGSTQTMLPSVSSVALDMGDPTDMSDAQNHSIVDSRRDVGATEYVCQLPGTHNETVCFGDSITVNGTVYNASNLTGTYTFTDIGVNHCDSTVTVTLTIENVIDVSTTTSGLTITANATGATYNWIDCSTGNSIVPSETGTNLTATANGDYAVVVTVGNCSDTSACVNINTVGINNHQNLINNINIYPNPAINKLTIENGNLKINNISILNLTGEIVKTTTVNTNIIDVSNLTQGIYFLQIHTDNGLVSKKFIKE